MSFNAFFSLDDKTGSELFAQGIVDHGGKPYSSGGTATALRKAGLEVIDVSQFIGGAMAKQIEAIVQKATGAGLPTAVIEALIEAFGDPIMDGRVKTLWPHVHAGFLFRRDEPQDIAELEAMCGVPFNIVCVNLYPMVEAIGAAGATYKSVIKATDVGGKTLLESAGKGGQIVVYDPADYDRVLKALTPEGTIPDDLQLELYAKALDMLATYTAAAANFHSDGKYPTRVSS